MSNDPDPGEYEALEPPAMSAMISKGEISASNAGLTKRPTRAIGRLLRLRVSILNERRCS